MENHIHDDFDARAEACGNPQSAADTEAAAESEAAEAAAQTEPAADNEAAAQAESTPLERAEAELAELKDKNLRQRAEFDNYRKRVLKEKAELILNGGEKVISAILPILDDFERARDNMAKADDIQAVKQGVELIIDKFMTTLHKEGLATIDAVGQPFDTDYHEAIAMIPAPSDEMKGKVIDCVQTGYTLNDKVIRHAKVAVAE